MLMLRHFFLFLFCLKGCYAGAQERGTLLLTKEHPFEVMRFVTEEQLINLTEVRAASHLLTDETWEKDADLLLPNRKKAVIRHIRSINEVLERYWYEKKPVDSLALEYLYELAWYEASYIEKALQKPKVNFGDKVKMGMNSVWTKNILQIRVPKDVSLYEPVDPPNSPFWNEPVDTIPAYKVFDKQAKQKKIRAKKQLVILFDQLSTDGSAPKIDALDTDLDNGWTLKWGDEVHTDVVGSRIFAALGYDTDHPYYYGKGELTLVFPDTASVRTATDLVERIRSIYDLNLSSFIADTGYVTEEMAALQPELQPYIGDAYVQFTECAVEARPDRVKRLGSFVPEEMNNDTRKALCGSLLAHQFIANWDTREANTLLTQVHMGDYHYRVSAVFSDLGTSLGVARSAFPPDFKTGLVNELEWEAVKRKRRTILFEQPMNKLLRCYMYATYDDLRWMASRIALLDSSDLRHIIKKAGWPEPVAELYFHKLASRRQSILSAFDIQDPHPIAYDRQLTIVIDGVEVVKNGKLVTVPEGDEHPESLTIKKGRFRNYGNKK